MWTELLPTTVDPDEAPGGLVMVVYVNAVETLVQRIASHRVHEESFLDLSGDYAAEVALAAHREGGVVSLQVFDGDSGERILTIPSLDAPRSAWTFHDVPS